MVFLRWSLFRSPLNKQVCPLARILYLLLKLSTRRRVFCRSFPFHVEFLKETSSFQGHKKNSSVRRAICHIVDLRSNFSRDNKRSEFCFSLVSSVWDIEKLRQRNGCRVFDFLGRARTFVEKLKKLALN